MTGPEIRVLQVVTSPSRRGAETFAVDLGSALSALGARTRTVALSPRDTGAPLPLEILGPGRWSPRTLLSLRQAAREADVVVAHGSATLAASALATSFTRTPFVYRLIGDPTFWSRGVGRRLRVGLLLHRAGATAVYFPAAASVLRARYRLAPDIVAVIPKGLPLDAYPEPGADDRQRARRSLGLDPDRPWVAFVGALTPEKRPALAVEAVGLLDDVGIVLAGEGPERAKLESMAAALCPRVRMIGPVTDPRDVYLAANAVVLTSETEGVPGVLMEAALCARPTVTTDVGGVSQILDPGVTGFVVDDDGPEPIARALAAAVERSDEIGARARSFALAHFDIEPVARMWLDLLGSVSESRRSLRRARRHPD